MHRNPPFPPVNPVHPVKARKAKERDRINKMNRMETRFEGLNAYFIRPQLEKAKEHDGNNWMYMR